MKKSEVKQFLDNSDDLELIFTHYICADTGIIIKTQSSPDMYDNISYVDGSLFLAWMNDPYSIHVYLGEYTSPDQ